jgi:hypothetical protein
VQEIPITEGNILDYVDISQLVCLSNLENLNAHFVSVNLGPAERLLKLNLIAIHQMTSPWRIRLFDQRGR